MNFLISIWKTHGLILEAENYAGIVNLIIPAIIKEKRKFAPDVILNFQYQNSIQNHKQEIEERFLIVKNV